MERLLYVSQSKINEAEASSVVARIVATSIERNKEHNLTGALIFTGTHFAQVLEGSQKNLDDFMVKIKNNPSHGSMRVIDRSPITERQFGHWSMAYQGPSQFVSRHVTQLLQDTSQSERQRAAAWLTELAREFVTYEGR